MRILHTADWHLGQIFFDRSRIPEQRMFLNFLLEVIEEHRVDLLVIAGDIFDTANPPSAAEELYYDFLKRIYDFGYCKTLIIGGNHDSALRLDAPSKVLAHLKICIVGVYSSLNLEKAFFKYVKDGVELNVVAIPYLRDRDVRQAVQGESFEDMEKRTRAGIIKVYHEMAQYYRENGNPEATCIATGHLTAVGGQLTDSERSIHIGNLGSINADQFPSEFSYVALGHLHHPQAVGNSERIRYSGSPIPLSFSESSEKELRLLEIQGDGHIEQKSIPIPLNRSLLRLSGSFNQTLKELDAIRVQEDELTPWVEVTLTDEIANASTNDQIRVYASEIGVEVLKVTILQSAKDDVNPSLQAPERNIQEWAPLEVFEKRLESYDGDIRPKKLADCFNEVLHTTEEEGAEQ